MKWNITDSFAMNTSKNIILSHDIKKHVVLYHSWRGRRIYQTEYSCRVFHFHIHKLQCIDKFSFMNDTNETDYAFGLNISYQKFPIVKYNHVRSIFPAHLCTAKPYC